MSDHFTEYEHQGWFGNMGNSFMGMLFGFVLFIASFWVHWWNEGRAVERYSTLENGQKNVIETKKFSPKNSGKLIHVTGKVSLKGAAADSSYNVTKENAVKLMRKVEMYQWEENKRTRKREKLGGGTVKETTYEYDEVWSDSLIDSKRFNQKYVSGHRNPSTKQPNKVYYSNSASVNGYKFGKGQIDLLKDLKILSVPKGVKIPAHFAQKAKILGDFIFVSSQGGSSLSSPRVGDYKISFKYLPASYVSIIAKQSDGGLAPFGTSTGELHEVRSGKMSATEIFKKAAEENGKLTWILRGVGLLCMGIGLAMCASPIQAFFNVIPFLGDVVGAITGFFAFVIAILLSSITIAVAWFAHRPMLSLAVGGGGIVIWMLLRMTQSKKSKA